MSSSNASLPPSSDEVIHADLADHLSTAPRAAERRGLTIALIAAAALHLIVPAAILIYAAFFAPRPEPPVQEIPVELVQEEPPPKPQPKKEQPPPPPPKPDDERPAYDAPSAATEEKANRESKEDKSEAPKSQADPSQRAGAPQPSQRDQASPPKTATAPPPPAVTPPAPDAELPAAPTPQPAEADAAPPAPKTDPNPAPPPAPPSRAPPGVPLPAPMEMPEPKFAHAATESPVIGGNADTRYFTIVYGMIRQHLRETSKAAPTRSGAVVFTVDEGGNLVDRRVAMSSGSPNLDVAVMAAIAEAAPYPAPPGWQPRSMRLTYGK